MPPWLREPVQLRVAVGAVSCLAIVAASALARVSLSEPELRVRSPRDADLVLIPGGSVQIGDDDAPPDQRPAFRYQAQPLFMDRRS